METETEGEVEGIVGEQPEVEKEEAVADTAKKTGEETREKDMRATEEGAGSVGEGLESDTDYDSETDHLISNRDRRGFRRH